MSVNDLWQAAVAPLRRVLSPFLKVDGVLYMVLLMALVMTLVLTAYSQFRTRVAYARLQELQQQHDEGLEHTGRLLLERSTLASLSRVDRQAREELGMTVPKIGDIHELEPTP